MELNLLQYDPRNLVHIAEAMVSPTDHSPRKLVSRIRNESDLKLLLKQAADAGYDCINICALDGMYGRKYTTIAI